MGVMECSRRKCDNIMCDTYVPDQGYICNECLYEFREYASDLEANRDEMAKKMSAFFDTEKGVNSKEILNVDQYIESLRIDQ